MSAKLTYLHFLLPVFYTIGIHQDKPNGQCVVSCTSERRNPQCALLVDQFAHLFVGSIKFTYVFTHADL